MTEPNDAGAGSEAQVATDEAAGSEAQRPKRTLEASLSTLDEDTRAFVTQQVQAARSEARNLRERLKVAEPKASQFDEAEERNKTQLQREQEARQQIESELSTLRTQTLRTAAARAAGLSAEDEQFLTATTEEELTAQATTLAARLTAAGAPQTPAPNPAQGSSALAAAAAAGNGNEFMNQALRAATGRGN